MKIIAVGEYASDVAGAAVEAGISSKRVFTAENSEQAVQIAQNEILDGTWFC